MEVTKLEHGFYRVTASYGFMDRPDVPSLVREAAERLGLTVDADTSTYFLGRESVLGRGTGAMGRLAEGIYGLLQRNAVAADRHFQIPPKQVVEIGIQLDL